MFPESDALQYVRGVSLDKPPSGMNYFDRASGQLLLEVVPDALGYLLSCRSNVQDPQFVAMYSEVLRHISGAWLQSRMGIPGDLVLETVVDPIEQPSHSLVEQSMRFGIAENSLPGLSKSVETFLSPRWSRTVSTMVKLGSGSNPVKLWSEGPKANIEDKIGLEAPLDFFPTDAYARVLQGVAVDFRSQPLHLVSSFLERVRKDHQFGK